MPVCVVCKGIKSKPLNKYCSNKCQQAYQHKAYIDSWKNNRVDGGRGVTAKGISKHVRRYLFEKYSNSCSQCSWNKEHPATKVVLLEINHIDGNSENNSEGNLELLCPNCHSLTPDFRNLNRGKGREWRRQKYIKHST
jgi:hypothetical protein